MGFMFTHTYMCVCVCVCMYTHTDAHTYEFTHARARARAHTHTHTHAHTHTHTQVTIVAGDTGCGKTTQVPQAYFDHEVAMGRGGECFCVVTQPRRVSAISVAERVAAERAERIGETVGYQIRQDSKLPSSTGSILFCTTGVLTRKLTSWAKRAANGQHGDAPNISVVFVDEVHERDVNSDFLLIVLKRLIDEGANIKVLTYMYLYARIGLNVCACAHLSPAAACTYARDMQTRMRACA